MTMFWTAFIWGLGVSVGASIGGMVFVILFGLWSMVSRSETVKRATEVAELSLKALDQRNEMTSKQIEALERIAWCAENIALSNKKGI